MTPHRRVRLFRKRNASSPLAEAEVPWPWLVPPPGCSYEIDGERREVRLWPRSSDAQSEDSERGRRKPDMLVGRVPVVSWDTDARRLVVTPLCVPPPNPFEMADLGRMWNSVLSHQAGIPKGILVQGRASAARRQVSVGRGWQSRFLGDLHAQGRSLLTRWPTRESVETRWRPVEVVGGREHSRFTEQGLGRQTATTEIGGRVVPQRTCRVLSTREEWKLSRIALISEAVLSALQQVSGEGDRDQLAREVLRTFRSVRQRARPSGQPKDPPISSWPAPLRRYLILAIGLLSELQASGTGDEAVPLSDFWRLYEEWSAIVVFRTLRQVLGDPSSPPREGNVASARWSAVWELSGEGTIAVYSQPSFGGSPRCLSGKKRMRFVSVTSQLIPDVAVSISDATDTRLFLVDAKHRSVGTGALSAGEVGSEAAKYLWGIRAADRPERTDGVDSVLLVSPFSGASLNDPPRARATSAELLPGGTGGESPESVVARWLYEAL